MITFEDIRKAVNQTMDIIRCVIWLIRPSLAVKGFVTHLDRNKVNKLISFYPMDLIENDGNILRVITQAYLPVSQTKFTVNW